MNRPIATALIGVGNSGRFYHLPHLLDTDRFDLRVVAAEREESAVRVAKLAGTQWTTDWTQAVSRADVELVIVALPHALHHPVALEALRRGKHVLVEKPMTVTLAEADELIGAAELAGTVLMVHHQRRWEADFTAVLDIVSSGEIGEVWRIVVARGHQGLYKAASPTRPHDGDTVLRWAHERRQGGGIARVVGPHPIDHLLALAGAPVSTVSARVHGGDGQDVEDWIGIEVGFSTGVTGRVDVFRWTGIAPPRFTVYGTLGTVIAVTSTDVEVRLKDGGGRRLTGLQAPGVLGAEIYADLYASIRNARAPRVTALDARAVVEVLELAFRSADNAGHTVRPGSARGRNVEGAITSVPCAGWVS